MPHPKPYRFLDNANTITMLGDELGKLDFSVSDVVDPGNGYDLAIVRLNSSQHPTDAFTIEFERCWWPDGINYEDSRIAFRQNESVICELDVARLRTERHLVPLSQLIIQQLTAAGKTATS